MDQPITVYGHDSEVKFLTACEIWEVATNEAIDKFGNEWRNKASWIANRTKDLTYENDLQKMVGAHLNIKA